VSRTEFFDIVYCPLGASAFGGAERSALDLAARFAARGDRVLMLVGPGLEGTSFVETAQRRGVVVKRVNWSPKTGFFANAVESLRVARAVRARIVHLNMSWLPWMWTVPLAFRLFGSGHVVGTMRAMPDPHVTVPRKKHFGFLPGLQLWHWPEVIVGWIWGRLLERTVTINAHDYPLRLVRDFGYPRERLVPIYNGIEPRREPLDAAVRNLLRRKVGASDADCVVCFAGRLSPEKGLHLLVEAISALPPRFRLTVVGAGPQRQEIEARARALGIANRVAFVGHTDAPNEWMAASDIVAVPSTWQEAFGRVVVEAMNEGTPVIASRVGGMAELFDDGIQGKFVTAGSVTELRDALAALGDTPDERKRMGEAGRQLVRVRYSLDRVEFEYHRLYSSLVTGAIAGPAAEKTL
jgi:glycosyltransferase involved in cell wall biosynthesis